MRPAFDDRDGEILEYREKEFNSRSGPRVGDYVRMPNGDLLRFTHDYPDRIQTTVGPQHPCAGDASFHLWGESAQFSGSLGPAIPKDRLVDTGETKDAPFWFFHHGHVQAHNGVYFHMRVRVYVYEN